MHENVRVPRQLRTRSTQLSSEAWHDLSRYVAASKSAPGRRPASTNGSDDRNG